MNKRKFCCTVQWNLKTRSICSHLSISTSALNVFFSSAIIESWRWKVACFVSMMNFDEFRFTQFRCQRSYRDGAYGHCCIYFPIIPWVCDFSFNIKLSDIILAKFRVCNNIFNASTSDYNQIFL